MVRGDVVMVFARKAPAALLNDPGVGRALGKIDTGRSSTTALQLDHDTDSITASHLHSFDRPHNVSRCITRRVAAIDLCRPSRGPPQCLDHIRGRGRRKGQGRPGRIQGIRGTLQGAELCELCRLKSQRGGQCDNTEGERPGGNRTRSVEPRLWTSSGA